MITQVSAPRSQCISWCHISQLPLFQSQPLHHLRACNLWSWYRCNKACFDPCTEDTVTLIQSTQLLLALAGMFVSKSTIFWCLTYRHADVYDTAIKKQRWEIRGWRLWFVLIVWSAWVRTRWRIRCSDDESSSSRVCVARLRSVHKNRVGLQLSVTAHTPCTAFTYGESRVITPATLDLNRRRYHGSMKVAFVALPYFATWRTSAELMTPH